jgi:uncharacterized membrane protein
MKITRKRSIVKALVYRVWIFLCTFVMLILTGQKFNDAIWTTIGFNFVLTFTYYSYDRLWQHIKWGIEDDRR